MPRASLPFPAMQNPRSFSVSSVSCQLSTWKESVVVWRRCRSCRQAELDKLSILRKSVADEFNIEVKMEGVSNTLDENPNYDYVFEALKHDSEGHEDEACLHDTLATFAAIDTDRSVTCLGGAVERGRRGEGRGERGIEVLFLLLSRDTAADRERDD
eukprot:2443824-Rhodomonas_salina.1